ncbi:Bug family tripartite tricarboxylate transporter substrate binding protein [Albibacillus kandeliae]|uniref:Bug family tripartite tricarboxylate transporter substrate binding protein n=1 Tax=Albibacillus kandeliae TaxID=2174228 RepID=UPI000D69B954|nr:tripartite tricarboxylate transporter substrate binding protein [Albibacillus kandeliae]
MTLATRRGLIAAAMALALGVSGFAPRAAHAEDYPAGPLTMYVGYKAGGQTDLVGRAVAKVLSDQLGVPVNVVNKPGGGGVLAAHELQKAAPDGNTFLFHANSVINTEPFMMKRIDFKPDDFEYAGMITAYQTSLATQKDAPYDDLAGFVAWAKENPGFSFGSLSPTSRMYMEIIAEKEGLDVNIVPLKGGGDMLNALLGNQVALVLSGGIHYKYPDQLKTISALTTFRQPSAPDVKTIEEDGYPLGMDSRTTLILPKGTPREVLEKLSTALKACETDADFKTIVDAADIPIFYFDLDQAKAEMEKSYAKNKEIIEGAGIEPK